MLASLIMQEWYVAKPLTGLDISKSYYLSLDFIFYRSKILPVPFVLSPNLRFCNVFPMHSVTYIQFGNSLPSSHFLLNIYLSTIYWVPLNSLSLKWLNRHKTLFSNLSSGLCESVHKLQYYFLPITQAKV